MGEKEKGEEGHCFHDSKEYILENIKKILTYNKIKKVNETIDTILSANKIFVYGVGRSGLIGKAFAMRLVQSGLKAYFIGETITPIVEPDDAVMIISRTGETYSAIQAANIARRIGAKLIVITSDKGSKLAHASNITLHMVTTNVRGEKRAKLAPLGTLFEDATLIFLDCIISEILWRRGETEESMEARHAIWV